MPQISQRNDSYLTVTNGEPGVLLVGHAVAITGDNTVSRANAKELAKMPAIGFVKTLYGTDEQYVIVQMNGEMPVGSPYFVPGDYLWVDPANPGGLVKVKPVASEFGSEGLVQRVGIGLVPSSEGSSGMITVVIDPGETPFPSPDSAVDINAIAVENILAGDILALQEGNANKAIKASSLSSKSNVVGIARTAVSAGETVSARVVGEMAVNFVVAPASSSNGSPVYVSGTAGKATVEAPVEAGNSIFKIGYLKDADGTKTQPTVVLQLDSVANI